MGTRVSRSMVELTPEREAIIKARRHIRPDEPGTNPGEPGNGHVLVIDETHQKFNGQKYHRNNDGYYIINKKVCGKNKMQFLHVNVWQFHNGEKPEGFVVHHNHRDENGQWDKSANDIEHLLLVTYSEHRLYHAKYKPPVVENTDSDSSNEEYSTLEDGRAETEMHVYVPRIEDTQKKVIRYCYYCHRPFEAYESSFETACDRPNCRGKEFIRDYTAALNNVLQDLMKHSDCGFKCFSKQFKEPIHCLFIDDEFWFVAEEICSIFECEDVLGVKTDFYSLSLLLHSPTMDTFTEWIEEKVLPAIHDYSKFIIPDAAAPELLLPDGTGLVFVNAYDLPYDFSHNDEIRIYRHICI